MKNSVLTQIMAAVDAFPGMPGATAELFALLQDADADVASIEKILRTDPGLTANILKLANSSYFGFAKQIGSVRQAVTLMGNAKIRQVVMVSCMNGFMDKPVSGYDLEMGELWRHAIAVSVAAEGLAAELNVQGISEVFTAALLHDMGKLVLGGFVADHIDRLQARASAEKVPYEMAEHDVLGIDHAEVGALLLEKWGLPGTIINAVRWHHNPEGVEPADPMIDLVHMADVLCLMSGIGIGREGLHYKLSSRVTARMRIQAYQIERVASRTIQEINDISELYK